MDKRLYDLEQEEIKEMVDIMWDAFMQQLKEWWSMEEFEELPLTKQNEILDNLMAKVKEKL